MFWKRAALFTLVTSAWAAPDATLKDPLLKDLHLAIRYGVGQVLIMGGEINPADQATSDELSAIYNQYPKIVKVSAGEWMNAVPPQLPQKFKPEPETNWRIGDRWQVYPGAGPPAIVIIETVVLMGSGACGCFRDGAIARIENETSANQIAGLRAQDYLAAPGTDTADVSQTPLFPLERESDLEEKVRRQLFTRARDVVKDENWTISADANISEEEKKRIQDLNRRFLSAEPHDVGVRLARWIPPGGRPLLFALALWTSEIDGKESAVFAAEAILEEGSELKTLSFEYREAEWMRVPEFISWRWDFESLSGFRNAWKIGNRYFLMRLFNGYEFAGVELEELDPIKGMVDTGLGYGF